MCPASGSGGRHNTPRLLIGLTDIAGKAIQAAMIHKKVPPTGPVAAEVSRVPLILETRAVAVAVATGLLAKTGIPQMR